jgi:hypothetical protein
LSDLVSPLPQQPGADLNAPALQRLAATLKGAVVSGSRDLIEVRWLAPRKHLIVDVQHPGELQDSICVHIALMWREPSGSVTYWANFLFECPDHACGRFLQWAPDGDLHAALFEAAANFTAADAHEVQAHLPRTDGRTVERTICLRGGPGVFAANVINGKDKTTRVLLPAPAPG